MSIRNHSIISICIVLITIFLVLIPSVSAGRDTVTSSTGKFTLKPLDAPKIIIPTNPKVTFFFQVDTNSIRSQPLPITENTTYACGNCGNSINPLDIPSKLTNYEGFTNITPPSFFLSGPTTACGMCGNSFIKPFQNLY